MAMLTSGEYNLLKKNVVHEKKSMIFVKLTNSAQDALNNYFRNQDKCEVPIIEFNKDEGRILIPNSSKNGSESKTFTAQFKFNVVSNITMQGRQDHFECVQHKHGMKELIKFGQLTPRIIIQPNEDVYETTKNHIAAIELERRKNCTVQLDWNSAVSRKYRINRTSKLNSSTISTIVDVKPKQHSNVCIRDKSPPNNYNKPSYANGIDSFHSKRCTKDILLPSLPNTYKRPGYINGVDGLQTKRQRISHFNKLKSSANDCDNFATSDSATSVQIKNHSAAINPPPQFQTPSSSDTSRIERPEQKPKYLKEYVTITNMDQRRKYKSDFSEIFHEYERVREEVNSISNHFAQLRESLRQHKKGSLKYSRIETEIFRKYYILKRSPKFEAAKNRLDYLHDKLSHIKNLVQEYDERELK